MKRAYFVRFPRTIDEVRIPHSEEEEIDYEIVKTVTLNKMDYDNFITDMLADRCYIEAYARLSQFGKPMRCIYITRKGQSDGILVVADNPQRSSFVHWAAYTVQ